MERLEDKIGLGLPDVVLGRSGGHQAARTASSAISGARVYGESTEDFSCVGTQAGVAHGESPLSALVEGLDGLPSMTPTILSYLKPLSAASHAMPPVDSTLRLSLNPVPDRRATVDGAWWPYSRNAAVELPGLITTVDRLLDRTTVRIDVHRDAWDHIPRRIPARGRQVRIDVACHVDPRVITLIFAFADPVVLLVIPPDAATGAAKAILRYTGQDVDSWADPQPIAWSSTPSSNRPAPE
ncbi:DUF5994 family protein [Nonomuraea sediminis]|uniref:DUF5994 family protein n=1 Tax=Nonomuraea sediminis TaxID=2835864 RepID=UPI001BDC29E6|nr:DUF5994 family protein [Nonomuraea sediminis]